MITNTTAQVITVERIHELPTLFLLLHEPETVMPTAEGVPDSNHHSHIQYQRSNLIQRCIVDPINTLSTANGSCPLTVQDKVQYINRS